MSFAARALTTSNKHDRRPPEYVLEVVRRVGAIALDPFTHPDNPTRAARFLTQADNAYAHDWTALADGGLTFVNPPVGSSLLTTVYHAQRHAERGCEIVLLTPARTDTRFGQALLQRHDALCFWAGRLDFEACAPELVCEQLDSLGEPKLMRELTESNDTFPVLFTYWGPHIYAFRDAFRDHGAVFLPGRGHTGPWARS